MELSGRFRAVAGSFTGTLLLFWVTSAVLPGQQTSTLGEIARKEQERRKKLAPSGKVYTNKDLPKSTAPAPSPAPAGAPAPSAGQSPAGTQKPQEPKGEEKDEAWWRKRITAVRTELQRNEMAADAFQTRVNALTTDFVNRDDPYQRAQISLERQKALNELERVKAEIVRLKQAVAEIEEEARVGGVPPGWLR